jgi:hypothetical protein
MATYAELRDAHKEAVAALRKQEQIVMELYAQVLHLQPCTACSDGVICGRTHGGVTATYSVHKCRCADCQKAWREYKRDYMKRNPEQVEKARMAQVAVAARRRAAKAARS